MRSSAFFFFAIVYLRALIVTYLNTLICAGSPFSSSLPKLLFLFHRFTQPPQTAAPSFYKFAPSQKITFGWNITSLSITPSQLTVSTFCSANGNTYPVGPTDGVIPGTATQVNLFCITKAQDVLITVVTKVVWDPYSYQQAHPTQPLIIASYTLQIMDNHGLTQLPVSGRFAPNTEMTFALYTPQTYTPLASKRYHPRL